MDFGACKSATQVAADVAKKKLKLGRGRSPSKPKGKGGEAKVKLDNYVHTQCTEYTERKSSNNNFMDLQTVHNLAKELVKS